MDDYMVFCTLFDVNYLDKGCVLYDSLNSQTDAFRLYILCMDDKVYDILFQMHLNNVILVSLNEILDDALITAQNNRSRGEFCWTCTSYIIKYVLEKYNEPICTYIDSDLYFYNSPKKLFEEFSKAKASIGIIEHRYNNNIIGLKSEESSGIYCVEFNTFKNDNEGKAALSWWMDSCLNECTSDPAKKNLGDQKYVEMFPKLFKGVYIYKNPGAGIGPWNIAQYSTNGKEQLLYHNRIIEPIFYHFHGITYYRDHVTIGVYYRAFKNDKRLVESIYTEYLKKKKKKRNKIKKKFGVSFNYKEISRKTTTESKNRDLQYYVKNALNPYILFVKFRILSTSKKDTIYYKKL